jgi:hypothetical protein
MPRPSPIWLWAPVRVVSGNLRIVKTGERDWHYWRLTRLLACLSLMPVADGDVGILMKYWVYAKHKSALNSSHMLTRRVRSFDRVQLLRELRHLFDSEVTVGRPPGFAQVIQP